MGGCQGCSTRANDDTNYLSVGKNGKIITQKGSGKLVAFVRQASVFGGTLVKQMEIPSSPPVDPTSESFTTKNFYVWMNEVPPVNENEIPKGADPNGGLRDEDLLEITNGFLRKSYDKLTRHEAVLHFMDLKFFEYSVYGKN